MCVCVCLSLCVCLVPFQGLNVLCISRERKGGGEGGERKSVYNPQSLKLDTSSFLPLHPLLLPPPPLALLNPPLLSLPLSQRRVRSLGQRENDECGQTWRVCGQKFLEKNSCFVKTMSCLSPPLLGTEDIVVLVRYIVMW